MDAIAIVADVINDPEEREIVFRYTTRPDMKKRNNPFLERDVELIREIRGRIGVKLADVSATEGKKDRPWGRRVEGSLIVHKDTLYLELIDPEVLKETYLIDAHTVDVSELEPFLKSKESKVKAFNVRKITNYEVQS